MNNLIELLNQLQDIRQNLVKFSNECKIAKLSDFTDDAELDVAKAIRNIKQAIKLAGKIK